jgi:hypothetical protein
VRSQARPHYQPIGEGIAQGLRDRAAQTPESTSLVSVARLDAQIVENELLRQRRDDRGNAITRHKRAKLRYRDEPLTNEHQIDKRRRGDEPIRILVPKDELAETAAFHHPQMAKEVVLSGQRLKLLPRFALE